MPDSPPRVKISALRFHPEKPPADQKTIEKIFALWASRQRFLILAGPPGVGKTLAAEDTITEILKKIAAPFGKSDCRLTELFPDFRIKTYQESEIKEKLTLTGVSFVWDLCVMHPQIAYEDLIRGYRMVESSSTPRIEVREGILGFLARVTSVLEALSGGDNLPKSVLVLDEINRAPLGQVLGEAMYALDRRRESVATPYALDGHNSLFSLPPTLLLLGTMNSVDRAISGFDFALRRRFATVYLTSEKGPIEKRLSGFGSTTRELSLGLYAKVYKLVRDAKKTGVVPTTELVIGHSYFLPPDYVASDEEAIAFLAKSLLYQIIPTLIDYQEQGLLEYQSSDLSAFPLGDLIEGTTPLATASFEEIEARIKGSTATPTIDANTS